MLQLYLFGLDFALTPVATASRVDVAGVEHVLRAVLALQRLNHSYERLSHFYLSVDAAARRGDLGNSIVMTVHVAPGRTVAGGRSAALDAQS